MKNPRNGDHSNCAEGEVSAPTEKIIVNISLCIGEKHQQPTVLPPCPILSEQKSTIPSLFETFLTGYFAENSFTAGKLNLQKFHCMIFSPNVSFTEIRFIEGREPKVLSPKVVSPKAVSPHSILGYVR